MRLEDTTCFTRACRWYRSSNSEATLEKREAWSPCRFTMRTVIVSVGVDLIELHRIRKIMASRSRSRFLERTFAPQELAYCLEKADPVPSLAARFAAKEAFQKTWAVSHGWRDVWVEMRGVKPVLCFSEALQAPLAEQELKAHLSLSHTLENAVAMVVLESRIG
jgi:holo-[acyl-carrier protein] synthase